jgi:hypothetical protein
MVKAVTAFGVDVRVVAIDNRGKQLDGTAGSAPAVAAQTTIAAVGSRTSGSAVPAVAAGVLARTALAGFTRQTGVSALARLTGQTKLPAAGVATACVEDGIFDGEPTQGNDLDRTAATPADARRAALATVSADAAMSAPASCTAVASGHAADADPTVVTSTAATASGSTAARASASTAASAGSSASSSTAGDFQAANPVRTAATGEARPADNAGTAIHADAVAAVSATGIAAGASRTSRTAAAWRTEDRRKPHVVDSGGSGTCKAETGRILVARLPRLSRRRETTAVPASAAVAVDARLSRFAPGAEPRGTAACAAVATVSGKPSNRHRDKDGPSSGPDVRYPDDAVPAAVASRSAGTAVAAVTAARTAVLSVC